MKLPSLPDAWATDFEEVGTDADGNSIHDDVALFTGEQMEAYATEAYAEGRKDERAEWMPLLTAVRPFIRFNSSEDVVTIQVKAIEIAQARAAVSRVEPNQCGCRLGECENKSFSICRVAEEVRTRDPRAM